MAKKDKRDRFTLGELGDLIDGAVDEKEERQEMPVVINIGPEHNDVKSGERNGEFHIEGIKREGGPVQAEAVKA